MNRNSTFSYQCRGCGRCCHNKRIQVNPYEVLRLSRNRGMTTGEFIPRHLETDGPWLQVRQDGACIFLADNGCQVHADRPLACRTYPLGRFVSADGIERFEPLTPHPISAGEYGVDGAVSDYLASQGEAAYSAAADHYQAVFYRLFDALQELFEASPDEAGAMVKAARTESGDEVEGAPAAGAALHEWLDVDALVESYCAEKGIDPPENSEETLNLHHLAIDQRVRQLTGSGS